MSMKLPGDAPNLGTARDGGTAENPWSIFRNIGDILGIYGDNGKLIWKLLFRFEGLGARSSDILRLGVVVIDVCWALHGYFEVGRCRDILPSGIAEIPCGLALLAVGQWGGFSADILRLGTAGILCRRARQGKARRARPTWFS